MDQNGGRALHGYMVAPLVPAASKGANTVTGGAAGKVGNVSGSHTTTLAGVGKGGSANVNGNNS